MQKIRTLLLSALAVTGLLVAPVAVTAGTAAAVCNKDSTPKQCIEDGSNIKTGGGSATLSEQIKAVVNVLLFILGAIAVIMIVVGGVRYTISNGESGAITGAKNTILYAVIGLIVAMLAYAIVNFVVGAF
jgi:hypothetical protein